MVVNTAFVKHEEEGGGGWLKKLLAASICEGLLMVQIGYKKRGSLIPLLCFSKGLYTRFSPQSGVFERSC